MGINAGFDAVWLDKLKQVCLKNEKQKTYKVHILHTTFDDITSGITDCITVSQNTDSPRYQLGDTLLLIRTYQNQSTAHRCVAMIRERTPIGNYKLKLKLGIIAVYEEG